VEVYPRPDGTVYICGIGGSDYISKDELKGGAFREVCDANESRVAAASQSFQEMSALYKKEGELDRVQACMRPCPPDALPYMGEVPGFEGAYINAGHNCWYVKIISLFLGLLLALRSCRLSLFVCVSCCRGIAWAPACGKAMAELVLDGESSSVNLAPFDPARFTPDAKRGGRGRKLRGESVGEQW
jgi:glycine/D-amino acid oxidase-like deaminating enzyme